VIRSSPSTAIVTHRAHETRELLTWRACVHANASVYAEPIHVRAVSWFEARQKALVAFTEAGLYIEPDHVVLRQSE